MWFQPPFPSPLRRGVRGSRALLSGVVGRPQANFQAPPPKGEVGRGLSFLLRVFYFYGAYGVHGEGPASLLLLLGSVEFINV